jgi:sec-independent protein translocase protein TatB
MFDFAWSEIIVIGAVALVVIGPKDLPRALRTAGVMVRRARTLAREFQNSVEEMVRESELEDVRKSVREATTGLEPRQMPENRISASHEVTQMAEPEPPPDPLPHPPPEP